MFKVIILAKRKPGIDRQTLIKLYEEDHIALVDKLVGEGRLPALVDYRRNYIAHDDALNIGSTEFDVITEAVFADRAGFEANRNGLTDPEVAQLVGSDMAAFLDMTDLRYLVVDQYAGGGGAPR